jgi:hypothetical protein
MFFCGLFLCDCASLVIDNFSHLKNEGCCHDCDAKHPNDAAAYTRGQDTPLGDMFWAGFNETETVRMMI